MTCPRCGHADTDASGDHLVLVEGPLTITRVGADADENMVRFRVAEPYIVTWCSRVAATMAELQPEFEERP